MPSPLATAVAALQEIASLPDVRADDSSSIARRALYGIGESKDAFLALPIDILIGRLPSVPVLTQRLIHLFEYHPEDFKTIGDALTVCQDFEKMRRYPNVGKVTFDFARETILTLCKN